MAKNLLLIRAGMPSLARAVLLPPREEEADDTEFETTLFIAPKLATEPAQSQRFGLVCDLGDAIGKLSAGWTRRVGG